MKSTFDLPLKIVQLSCVLFQLFRTLIRPEVASSTVDYYGYDACIQRWLWHAWNLTIKNTTRSESTASYKIFGLYKKKVALYMFI